MRHYLGANDVYSCITAHILALHLLHGRRKLVLGIVGVVFFLFSVIAIPFMLALGAYMTFVGYITIESYFTEAWESFTVEVESLEAPLEGV